MAQDRGPQSRHALDFDDVTSDGRAWAARPRFAETHLESAAFEARRAYALEQKLPAGPKYEEQYYPDLRGTENLLRLRNLLTHFTGGSAGVRAEPATPQAWSVQPVPTPNEPGHPTNLEGILHGTGFALNPLEAARVFPFAYLGYGCAAGAVESSWEFIDELYGRLGKRSPFAATEEYARLRNLPSPFTSRPLPPAVDPAG